MHKIGILYVCTGKYSAYWDGFFERCEKDFLQSEEIHYFVWTDDSKIIEQGKQNDRIHTYYQEVEEWPFPTLRRFEYFLRATQDLRKMDYLMFMNANMYVMERIDKEEILPENNEMLFVTLHPGYFEKSVGQYTYDNNPDCEAYVEKGRGEFYFAGGFNGGKTAAYLRLIQELDARTKRDYQKGIIALWHDESQLNRYMLDYEEEYRIISPAYLYPEGWNIPFEKKILILDKNKMGGHNRMRNVKEK